MGTGIFNEIIPGFPQEVSQTNIDFWCNQCQFPLVEGKCKEKADIQKCWNRAGSNAGFWHLLHECPFNHVGQKCRCNEFKERRDAFASLGLVYQEPKNNIR